MVKKTSILLALSVFTAAMLFVSCSSKSHSISVGKAPEVEVVAGSSSGNTTGNAAENTTVNTGDGTGNSVVTKLVILIKTDDNKKLTINGEFLDQSVYNPEKNSNSIITITDSNGKECVYKIDADGNITITPADGSVNGSYTVIIIADGREYVLTITVTGSEAVVNSAVSYQVGSSIVMDLDHGKIINDGVVIATLTQKDSDGKYIQSDAIKVITVKDKDGNDVSYIVDDVTGDLVVNNNGSGPYVITIVTLDGKLITIKTDADGKIIDSGIVTILIPVVEGKIIIAADKEIAGVTINALITVAQLVSGDWTKCENIGISAVTGITSTSIGSSITITIDSKTGAIVTTGVINGTTKITITEDTSDGKVIYIITLDENGIIEQYTKSEVKNNGTQIVTIILFEEGSIKLYEEKIITNDGETTTTTVIVADGKATATVENYGVMLRLVNGSVSTGEYSLQLTEKESLWTLINSDTNKVIIKSAMAADGTIALDVSKIFVDPVTGYILLYGDGKTVQAGPYVITVSINGIIYVIKTDESGSVETILSGKVILQLADGVITYSDRDVLNFASKDSNTGLWSFSGQVSQLQAKVDGSEINIRLDAKGNIVTDSEFYIGNVTISFIYTDAKGNGITYTLVLINGSISSYIAEITDPGPDFDFSTVTNIKVFLNVVDEKTGLPVKQAAINLTNTAVVSWVGFTDDFGKSVFTATVALASQTTSIAVTHTGYTGIDSPITGIGKLIEIGKKIAMVPEVAVIPPTDTDNDGVADSDDEYPNDATGAKSITSVNTLAFEDQYYYNSTSFNTSTSNGNDADFNDLVVRLTITEKIDSKNKIREIIMKTKLLAASAGCSDSFGIYVNGTRYILILDPKAAPESTGSTTLGSVFNALTTDKFVNCVDKIFSVTLPGNGVERKDIGLMPYDPFMIPAGGSVGVGTDGPNEVHLASVGTTYTGVRSGNGFIKGYVNGAYNSDAPINGFVWALMIPENWQWPYESTCIGVAYPQFIDWCNSGGAEYKDWYNHPDTTKVFKAE